MGVRLTVLTTVTPGMLRTVSIIAFSYSSSASPVCPTRLRSKSTSIAPGGCMPSGVCSARTMPALRQRGRYRQSADCNLYAQQQVTQRHLLPDPFELLSPLDSLLTI